jgi:hypothetical protein
VRIPPQVQPAKPQLREVARGATPAADFAKVLGEHLAPAAPAREIAESVLPHPQQKETPAAAPTARPQPPVAVAAAARPPAIAAGEVEARLAPPAVVRAPTATREPQEVQKKRPDPADAPRVAAQTQAPLPAPPPALATRGPVNPPPPSTGGNLAQRETQPKRAARPDDPKGIASLPLPAHLFVAPAKSPLAQLSTDVSTQRFTMSPQVAGRILPGSGPVPAHAPDPGVPRQVQAAADSRRTQSGAAAAGALTPSRPAAVLDAAPAPVAARAALQLPHEAQVLQAAVIDPTLRLSILPQVAHLNVQIDGADLALHLRMREGVANVTVAGEAAPLLASRAPDLRAALAGHGLLLGKIDPVAAAPEAGAASGAGQHLPSGSDQRREAPEADREQPDQAAPPKPLARGLHV